MENRKRIRTVVLLTSPLLLFLVLLLPYSWVNRTFLVEWFGCGCPKVDALGQIITPDFNANDFTALFWLFIAACATVLAVFSSKKIPKEKLWLKVLYVVGIFAASVLIAWRFTQMMMWN